MVHARDLFRIMLRGKALTSEYIHAIPKVPKTVKFDNVVEIADNVRLAIILDEHGGTSGLLTLTDVFSEVMGWDRGRIRVLTDLPRDAVGFSCDVSDSPVLRSWGKPWTWTCRVKKSILWAA